MLEIFTSFIANKTVFFTLQKDGLKTNYLVRENI